MSENLTALQTLKILLPEIRQWRIKPRFSGFYLNNGQEGLSLDGKDMWECSAYSAKSNKIGNFMVGRPLIENTARPELYRQYLDQYLSLDEIDSSNLLDSDWVAKKAIEYNLPFNDAGRIRAVVSGGINWFSNELSWSLAYYKTDITPIEQWDLTLDMQTGKEIKHVMQRQVFNPPVPLPGSGKMEIHPGWEAVRKAMGL